MTMETHAKAMAVLGLQFAAPDAAGVEALWIALNRRMTDDDMERALRDAGVRFYGAMSQQATR